MKINKQAILTVIGFLLICLITSSCASKSDMHDNSIQDSPSMDESGAPELGFGEESQPGINSNDIGGIEPEKIITNVYISLETTEFDSTIKGLNGIISRNKGYIESSHISSITRTNNRIFKHAEYTIRIPRDNIDSFTDEMDSVGNLVSRGTSKEDITKQYYDTKSRLNLLKTKEERMTELLKKAQKIEDIITIENQLSEIIYQKENLTKNILDMDDKVSYSIVNINISEVEKLRGDITTKTTFATKVFNTFSDSLYVFKIFIEKFTLVFIYALPFLLVGGTIIFLIIKIIKIRRGSKTQNRENISN